MKIDPYAGKSADGSALVDVARPNIWCKAWMSGSMPASLLAADYTPRIVPHFQGVAVPLEEGRILWQR